MTGAGSATPVAFAPEGSYLGSLSGTPTFYEPGLNPSVEELNLDRQLQRLRQPDSALPLTSISGNLEGACSVSFDLAGTKAHIDNWLNLIFSSGSITTGLAPSARWYFGVNLPSGGTEYRVALGTVITQAQIQYQQGQRVRVTLTMLYGDETKDATEFDTNNLERPGGGEVYVHHGTSLTIDASTVETYLQGATLDLSNLARPRRGASEHPVDFVTGAVEPSLSTEATFTESGRKDIMYGGTTPAAMLDEVTASLAFENDDAESVTFSLDIKPTNYSWNNLVAADSDLAEPINWHVSDVSVA